MHQINSVYSQESSVPFFLIFDHLYHRQQFVGGIGAEYHPDQLARAQNRNGQRHRLLACGARYQRIGNIRFLRFKHFLEIFPVTVLPYSSLIVDRGPVRRRKEHVVETAASLEEAQQSRLKQRFVAALHPGGMRQFIQLHQSGFHFPPDAGDCIFRHSSFRLLQTLSQIFFRKIVSASGYNCQGGYNKERDQSHQTKPNALKPIHTPQHLHHKY